MLKYSNSFRKKSKKNNNNILIFISLAISFVILCIILVIFINSPSYDKKTSCPINTKNKINHHLIVIDGTENLSKTQIKFLKNKINLIKNNIEPHDRFSIYILDQINYLNPLPKLSICNPGSSIQANQLYQNSKMVAKKYEERFNSPINNFLQSLKFKKIRSKESPIFEMLQSLSDVINIDYKYKNTTIYLFSDLLHNTKQYNQYTINLNNITNFITTKYAKNFLIKFNNIDIEIYYLKRNRSYKYQNKKHQNFWKNYLSILTGANIKLFRIIG